MRDRVSTTAIGVGRIDLYVSDCARCAVVFGMSVELEARRREDHGTFYCPNGHSMSFQGETKAEREARDAKKRADHLSARLLAEMDQSRAALREAAEAKASEIRIRWRVGNGVCPCCQRTFSALAQHVIAKHPEFVHHDIATLSVRMQELMVTLRRATEEQDVAVVEARDIGANMATVRALERRGLVETIDYWRVALTEAGWPIAEQIAGRR